MLKKVFRIFNSNKNHDDKFDFLSPVDLQKDFIFSHLNPDLLNDLSKDPIVRCIHLPSLTLMQELFTVQKRETQFILIYRKMPQVFSERDLEFLKKEEISIPSSVTKEKIISPNLTKLLQKLVLISLEHGLVKEKTSVKSKGADGSSYYFSAFKNGKLESGYIWSPHENTKTFELRSIFFELSKIINDEINDAIIADRIESLEKRFITSLKSS